MPVAPTPARHRARRSRLAAAGIGIVTALVAVALTNVGGAAQAATLFSDDFNDGNYTGWSKSGGDWAIVNDGSGTFEQSKIDSELARQFAGSSWTNYTVQARVKPTGFSGSNRYAALAPNPPPRPNTRPDDGMVLPSSGRAVAGYARDFPRTDYYE